MHIWRSTHSHTHVSCSHEAIHTHMTHTHMTHTHMTPLSPCMPGKGVCNGSTSLQHTPTRCNALQRCSALQRLRVCCREMRNSRTHRIAVPILSFTYASNPLHSHQIRKYASNTHQIRIKSLFPIPCIIPLHMHVCARDCLRVTKSLLNMNR